MFGSRKLGSLVTIFDRQRKPVTKRDRVPGKTPYCGANGIVDYVSGFTHEGKFVLIAEDGGNYGPGEKSAYIMEGRFWANNHVHVVKTNPSILPEYLLYNLIFLDLTPYTRGATRKKINQGQLKDIDILVPHPSNPEKSLQEQHRIVARIESLLTEVKQAKKLHSSIVKDTEQLIDSVLGEVFGNFNNLNSDNWQILKVSDICEKPQYGYTQSSSNEQVGPKFLRITDIQNGKVDWSLVPYCECEDKNFKKYRVKEGDIFFTRTGATTGKTYLAKGEIPDAVFASYLIRLVVKNDDTNSVEPEYLYVFFQSPQYWKQIIPRGGAQPNMNATLLGKVRVPIPSNKKQQCKIINEYFLLKENIDSIRITLQKQKDSLQTLEQSILSQAFKGEL